MRIIPITKYVKYVYFPKRKYVKIYVIIRWKFQYLTFSRIYSILADCLVCQWSSLVIPVLISSTRTKLYFSQLLIN